MSTLEITYSDPLASINFGDITSGTISFSAPIEHGNLQLGIVKEECKDLQTTMLDLRRTDQGDITVMRRDGLPLQAEVVVVREVDEDGKYIPEHLPVFATAVPSITFLARKALQGGDSIWVAAALGLVVPEHDRLETFAATVRRAAVRKQQPSTVQELSDIPAA